MFIHLFDWVMCEGFTFFLKVCHSYIYKTMVPINMTLNTPPEGVVMKDMGCVVILKHLRILVLPVCKLQAMDKLHNALICKRGVFKNQMR